MQSFIGERSFPDKNERGALIRKPSSPGNWILCDIHDPDEFESDGYELNVAFLGGNPKHSLSTFEIRQFPARKAS